jgi:hypothetical protein
VEKRARKKVEDLVDACHVKCGWNAVVIAGMRFSADIAIDIVMKDQLQKGYEE